MTLGRATTVFVIALVIRIVYLAIAGPHESPDSAAYEALAGALVSAHRFVLNDNPIAYPPLYPALMAALRFVGFSSLRAIAIVQSVLDAGVAVVVFSLASKAAAAPRALMAGIFYAVHPGAIYLTDQILTEAFFTAVLAAGVALLVFGVERDRILHTVLAGTVFGAAVLTRSIALLLPAALIAALWFATIKESRFRYRHVAALLTGTVVVVAPWMVRCSLLARHIVLVQGRMAINFYVPTRYDLDQSNYAATWATTDGDQRQWWQDVESGPPPPAGVPSVVAWKVAEADRRGMQHAARNVRSNPVAYLESRARAYPYLFLTSFDSFTGINKSFRTLLGQGLYGQLFVKCTLLAAFSLGPLVLAVLGVVRSPTVAARVSAAVWLYGIFIQAPLWIEYRFWQPFVPFMIVSAAIGFPALVNRLFVPHPAEIAIAP